MTAKLDTLPVFVSRETAAARLEISTTTWDIWVRDRFVPQPAVRRGGVVRWHWPTVEASLAGLGAGAVQSDPYSEGVKNGHASKGGRRAAA